MKHYSSLILVNNAEVKFFYESMGIPSNKLKIISSAINVKEHKRHILSRTEARKYLGLVKSSDVIIGYIGGLKHEKNVEVLIKAFSDFIKNSFDVKVKLIIIGDGPARAVLEEAVNERNISNYVFFLGYVPDAYRFLSAIDIFVLPSLSEGSPIVILEAMVCGRAIIASNIPAIKEMVKNGKEALLFDPHNSAQLENLILTLYNNSKLRKKLGENARRRVKQYDVNVVFPKILQIYKRVLRSSANSN